MSEPQLALKRLAESRDHLLTVRDLQDEAGLTTGDINRLVRSNVLTPVSAALYTTATVPPVGFHLLRGLCRSRPDLVVSFDSAAAAWGMRRRRREQSDVTIPKGRTLRVPDVTVHYSNDLADVDVVDHVDGLRVTTPARTVFDLTGVVDLLTARSILEDALHRELVSLDELDDVASRLCGRGRRGSRMFGALLAGRDRAARPVMSEAELMMADALEERGLSIVRQKPLRLPNGSLILLDLAVEQTRIDVEIDHSHWHAGPVATQRDKNRDNQVRVVGWEPMRFTEHDVQHRLAASADLVHRVHDQRLDLLLQPGSGRRARPLPTVRRYRRGGDGSGELLAGA